MDELDKQIEQIINGIGEKPSEFEVKIEKFGKFLVGHGYKIAKLEDKQVTPPNPGLPVVENKALMMEVIYDIDYLICQIAQLQLDIKGKWFFPMKGNAIEALDFSRGILDSVSTHLFSQTTPAHAQQIEGTIVERVNALKKDIPNVGNTPNISGHPIALKFHTLRALTEQVAAKMGKMPKVTPLTTLVEYLFDLFYYMARRVNISTGHKEFIK